MDRPIFSYQGNNYYNVKPQNIHAKFHVRTNVTYYEDKVVRDYVAENATFEAYDMTNLDDQKNYYNVNLKTIHARFYINNGTVSGIFENVFFSDNTFWDCSTFENCSFINCQFEKLDIRWCNFNNCQFVGCTGIINYIRASKFEENCSFTNSDIKIEQVDEYFIVNKKRYKDGDMKLCE